ncbi:hypothetical protein NE237_012649 [Protea cynaroides]|uniref:Embryonic stem cell-specific 5-hydroxymethylcytosine-binding protein n=1 Tax=Protea cynaroides TaxID=273540 RepID=A0A9Q0GX60_9MAGN|nr:hypothetical protein NE237_012649 [Protea cynaroides]
MCGRTRCTLRADDIPRACGINEGRVRSVQMDRYRQSYNVSPGSYMPVVRREDGSGGDGAVLHCMKWGLIPSFTKKSEKPDHFRMFNARSESISEKASFNRLVHNNRCLVTVEGFYEWKKDGSKKQPYYIHFKDERPLVFAALYDSWKNSEGEVLYTFTILTTCSSSALRWLHDRMPVILGNKGSIDAWLNGSSSKLDHELKPYEDTDLVWYPVTSAMGKTSLNGPECIKEIKLKSEEKNSISKFFTKKTENHQESARINPLENVKVESGSQEDSEDTTDSKGKNGSKPDVSSLLHEEAGKCGIKREYEESATDLKPMIDNNDKLETSPAKKKANLKSAGDNQTTHLLDQPLLSRLSTEDFESLPLNIVFNRHRSKPKIKPSEAVEANKSVDPEKKVGKPETPKFNFLSSFFGGKAEDKGKVVAIPDSLKKRKITTYMPLSKSITMGSPIQDALAPTDINPDQSFANLVDVVFTTTTGDKRDVDSAIPSSELFVMVINFLNEKEKEYLDLLQKCESQEKAFSNERLKLLQKYESAVSYLNKERENTLVERRKVYMERERAIVEKEKLKKELNEVKLNSSTELEELKEEKKNLESKLKETEDGMQIKINDAMIEYRDSQELYDYICVSDQFEPLRQSLGSVASKKALFELLNFVVEKHLEFNFPRFIVDFNFLTPPTPDEDDNSFAPTNNVSNMEVDPFETVDRVGGDA